VLVKRAGVVYVLGAVNRPGGYVMQEFGKLDVAQALAIAGGPLPEAKVGGMRVIHRRDDGTLSETPVEYRKISSGKVQAISLSAEDIVYVPVSALKTALLKGTQVVAAAASASIYVAN
jgi:polysaccharide export outer membrane protein